MKIQTNLEVSGKVDLDDGDGNAFIGFDSGYDNTTGNYNSALGYQSLYNNTTGANNVAIGRNTLNENTTGSNNIAIGPQAGQFRSDGTTALIPNNGVYLGANTKGGSTDTTNEIVIGYNSIGNGSNTVTIGNSSITDNYFNGDLTTTADMYATDFILSSDKRLKQNIKPLNAEAPQIEWKEFNFIENPKQRYGVIAQDVEKTHPELVSTNKNGMKSVSYIDLLVLKMAEKDKQIEELKKDIELLKILIK